ncbi:hypothetical protein DPMN_036368 [Dreissena polymorpha]|uniref:Uncharacterized protein n=2 Tax=Dreissena polymorpha TaxID=45954 RepID=A0A9D4MBE2_DREPO|nr:hypothetical protein DPMN_036368 [Dreissena polymorpha]
MDSGVFDSEIFKASCELICEWAEKLLDSKFNSVQSIAEYLVGNMFVNTKSVAAFTLISSLPEGKQNSLKGSPLFSQQSNTSVDKHKETNMLLHQKLQKNRQLQKQKEKAQSLKSEVEQQSGNHGNLEGLMPLLNARKSVTPSAVALKKSNKNPSPSSSPLPERSPMKNYPAPKSSPLKPKNSASGEVTNIQAGSIDSAVKYALSNKLKGQNPIQSKMSVNETKEENEPKGESENMHKDQKGKNKSKKGKPSKVDTEAKVNLKELHKCVEQNVMETDNTEYELERNDIRDEKPEIVDARTPGSDMETEIVKGHVKKLNFEDNIKQHIHHSCATCAEHTVTTSFVKPIKSLSHNVTKMVEPASVTKDLQQVSQDALSKSTGELGLIKLLESKDKLKTLQLNKSMGFIEKSKNSLFVNQSKMAVKSAFVPFSQFQSSPRKDSLINQSVISIPVMIPSVSSQSVSVLNFTNPANEAISVVSVTSVLSKMSNDTIVSSSQNMSVRQSGLKFAPIRPKASPIKTSPLKDTKPESLSRREKDSRRVSAILKEQRAIKEQAEAKAKLQSDVKLSSIPMQPGFTITGNTLQLPQTVANSLPPVFIVNNQGAAIQQLFEQNLTSSVIVSEGNLKPVQPNTDPNTVKIKMNTGKAQKIGSGVEHSEYIPESLQESDETCISISDEMSQANSDCNNIANISENGKDLEMIRMQSGPNDSRESETRDVIIETVEETSYETANVISDPDLAQQKFGDLGGLTSSESVDKMWSETPAKIAKLNITSPYRPESACSFGRETPTRLSRCDSNLSRPESACSIGRDTPSGSRKRKSSDHPSRRNFKRLNSTGEDVTEDIQNTSLVFGPETDSINRNLRRTQSCTSELEDVVKQNVHGLDSFSQHVSTPKQLQQYRQQHPQHKSELLLMKGLQSPDISSLEKDALIESFPNSGLLYLRPQGQTNKNSINALKQSKPSLDKLMQEFLEAKAREKSIGGRENKEIAGLTSAKKSVKMSVPLSDRPFSSIGTRSRSRNDASGSVTTDRGKPYFRPASAAMVTTSSFEPSGLPADVADWVSENLEKRQRENQSEPDLNQFNNQSGLNVQTNPLIKSFEFATDSCVNFETSRPTSIKMATTVQSTGSIKMPSACKDDQNTFTVPKAPHISHPRHREHIPKPSSESAIGQQNQRCQSLPTFSSPGQSPLSPLSPMGRFHGNLRASSMSPRATGQPMEISTDVLSPPSAANMSPVAGSISPIRLLSPSNVHGSVSVTTGYISPGKEHMRPGSTYLRKIQHSLQMPIDSSYQNQYYGSQNVTLATANFRSRESSLEVEDKILGRTHLSDSGFHSADPSPISNSTPVSSIDCLEYSPISVKLSVAESPVPICTDYTYLATTGLLKQSQIPQQLSAMASPEAGNPSFYGNTLRSSSHSAFVPIQGSHSDAQHVAPVKPTVTLPLAESLPSKEGTPMPENLCLVSSQKCSEMPLLTQQPNEPPPYELAVQQLKNKSCNAESRQSIEDPTLVQNSFKNQMSLFNMLGNSDSNDPIGPFASKLRQLSQQSKSTDDTLDLNSDLWLSMDLNDFYNSTEQYGQLLSVVHNNSQSNECSVLRQTDQSNPIGSVSMFKMPLSSGEVRSPSSVLSQSAIYNSVPLALGSPIYSVQNIDSGPSIPPMPVSGATNQIPDSSMMSSHRTNLDLMCNKPLYSVTKTSGSAEHRFSSLSAPPISTNITNYTTIKTKNVLIGGKTIDQVQKENLLLDSTESPESADNVEDLPFSLDDLELILF